MVTWAIDGSLFFDEPRDFCCIAAYIQPEKAQQYNWWSSKVLAAGWRD